MYLLTQCRGLGIKHSAPEGLEVRSKVFVVCFWRIFLAYTLAPTWKIRTAAWNTQSKQADSREVDYADGVV